MAAGPPEKSVRPRYYSVLDLPHWEEVPVRVKHPGILPPVKVASEKQTKSIASPTGAILMEVLKSPVKTDMLEEISPELFEAKEIKLRVNSSPLRRSME